jgi:ribosome biogenesis protein NSA1
MKVIVGDETGLVKNVQLETLVENRWGTQARTGGVRAMCWDQFSGDEQPPVAFATVDGNLKVLEQSMQNPTTIGKFTGKCMAVAAMERGVLTCAEDGTVSLFDRSKDLEPVLQFDTQSPVNRMRAGGSSQATCIATGGKEHDVHVWDTETQQIKFRAKNVPHDTIELRVPIWVKDMQFLKSASDSAFKIVTGTAYGEVRLYDSSAKRRPVHDINVGEYPVTTMCLTPDETSVIIGDTIGTLSCYDMRTWQVKGRYIGPAGSITDVECHPVLPFVGAVSLDRSLHVYHIDIQREPIYKAYLKQRLTCMAFGSEGQVVVKKPGAVEEEEEEEEESDGEEYEGLDAGDGMSTSDDDNFSDDENDSMDDGDEDDMEFMTSKPQNRR